MKKKKKKTKKQKNAKTSVRCRKQHKKTVAKTNSFNWQFAKITRSTAAK